jgi:hypothetical protein
MALNEARNTFTLLKNKGTITGVDSADQAPGDLGKSPPKVEAKKPDESKASQTVVETATPPQNNLGLASSNTRPSNSN